MTTTVDGLRVLQMLAGIEVLAPELGLRPILPRVESARAGLAHPMAAELLDQQVLDGAGTVDPVIVEWLTVLARRDIGVLVRIGIPGHDEPARVLLARFTQWWVALERTGDLIRIGGAGRAGTESAAVDVLDTALQRLCGTLAPAPLRPVTLDADALQDPAGDPQSLRDRLIAQRVDADQLQLLLTAVDPRRSAQATVVAMQSGVDNGRPTRTHVQATPVTVIDTPQGRLVAERVPSADRMWLLVAPGTAGNIRSAVHTMLRRLPAERDWYSYRKAV